MFLMVSWFKASPKYVSTVNSILGNSLPSDPDQAKKVTLFAPKAHGRRAPLFPPQSADANPYCLRIDIAAALVIFSKPVGNDWQYIYWYM
jgi:hypothetical protein